MKKVKIKFKCLEFPVGLCFVERMVGLAQLLTSHTTVKWLERFSCQCADKCQEALAKGSDIRASCPIQHPLVLGLLSLGAGSDVGLCSPRQVWHPARGSSQGGLRWAARGKCESSEHIRPLNSG